MTTIQTHRHDPAPRFRGIGEPDSAIRTAPVDVRPGVGHRPLGDLVEVTCWCEAQIVSVRLDDVRAGLTGACRKLTCRRIDRDRRHR